MLSKEKPQLIEVTDLAQYYQSYFTTLQPTEWNLDGFETHYLARPPPDFAEKDNAIKLAQVKGHYHYNLRLIAERQPPFTDANHENQARASELLELLKREQHEKKKRKRDCFIANQKPESEPPAKRIDGNVDIPTTLYNVNVRQINVNGPITGRDLNVVDISPHQHVPDLMIVPESIANADETCLPRFPSTPTRCALLDVIPDISVNHDLELFHEALGTRETSLPPTVVLSPPDTTIPSIGKLVIPSHILAMPFDLHYNLIEDDRKFSLRSGGTLEELMLDIYQTNQQHSLLRKLIDWGLIYLSDATITEHLHSNTIRELQAVTRKAPENCQAWKRAVERYRHTSFLTKETQSSEPLERWYSTSLFAFKEYPASILSYADCWRHERFYSFLDNLFSISSRINRRRTMLTQTPSKRDPSHCDIYEYFDRDCGFQLAYLEHQLHATNPDYTDIFYLSRVLLGSYREWLNVEYSMELVVFAVICSGPRITIYRLCPVSHHFAVVTAYTAVITMETLPKVLEMLYKMKLSMDNSLRMFDKHFGSQDPF